MRGPGANTILEWQDNVVRENGADVTPLPLPFAAPPPVADFGMPGAATVGETVRFASKTQGAIARALWDFDDGLPAVGRTPTHVYERPGDYRVTLVVWDASGRAGRCQKRIEIAPAD